MAGQVGGSVVGSGSGSFGDDVTVADDLTVTAGPIVLGDGSGSVELRMNKSDAGTATLGVYVGGVLRGSFVVDANENTVIQPPAAGSAGTGSTTAVRGGIPGAGEGIGGSLNLQGADAATATATSRAGGNINMTPGLGVSGGADGMQRCLGAFAWISILSPATLSSGSTDDYAPTGIGSCTTLRLTPDAGGTSVLSGIVPTSGGSANSSGRIILLINIGSANLTLDHDAASTTTNRFLCPNNTDLVMPPNSWRLIWYDITSTRWRVSGAVA